MLSEEERADMQRRMVLLEQDRRTLEARIAQLEQDRQSSGCYLCCGWRWCFGTMVDVFPQGAKKIGESAVNDGAVHAHRVSGKCGKWKVEGKLAF